jgi:hypothetical protein
MYSTCLYCTKDLGANAVLETLPIGRRVAFDAVQGRLWVICRSCEKWNLVPFDTRLETIDACERLFAETRVRFSTANIGIARLREGLELVRVGAAQRPEFAAWRYGDQFGRRRWRNGLQVGAMSVAVLAVGLGRHSLFPWLGVTGGFAPNILSYGNILYQRRRVAARIAGQDGDTRIITRHTAYKTQLHVFGDSNWLLRVPTYGGSRGGFVTDVRSRKIDLTGREAITALGQMLPTLNFAGGSRKRVREAVGIVEERPDINALATIRPGLHPGSDGTPAIETLKEMDKTVRLALEMAAHEETERTALAGELKLLERQWQEAEEIARIADSLAVSDDVDRQVSGVR